MRVLIQADMEGVAHITNERQVLPFWIDYWETGRAYLTEEVTAAALGLLAGGVSDVVVDDQHLGGPSNLLHERLPETVSLPGPDVIYRQLEERAFDAVFQLARHSRWGTGDGFMSHTQLPYISLALDGQPFTESHICAWRAGAPVLGITGDDRLGAQLDGGLAGTPFLAVKRSRGLTKTRPIERARFRSLDAIRDFATACANDWRARTVAALPEHFTLSAHLAPELAEQLDGSHGFRLSGHATVAKQCAAWWGDAEPAMQAATGIVARPFAATMRALGDIGPERLDDIDGAALDHARDLYTSWLHRPETNGDE
ncbi:MAG TPA: M55 family metallopeptidase [Nitrolancea sp.]|nr:M55 family metallopeptidase [Nitrolancea sp.]